MESILQQKVLLLLPILFPIVSGAILLFLKSMDDRKKRQWYVAVVVIANAVFVLTAIYLGSKEAFVLYEFSEKLSLKFYIDGLSMVFGTMVSILWVITTFYAFEYMKHEGRERQFFSFFIMTFGVVIGIAFSKNMLTLYLAFDIMY